MERAAQHESHRAAKHAIAWLFGFALSLGAASTRAQSSRPDARPPYEHEYQMLSAARTDHDVAAIVAAAQMLGRHAQRNRGIDAYLAIAATVEALAEIDHDDAALPFANALIARPVAFADPLELMEGRGALERVLPIAAHIEASRGHLARAFALAQRAAAVDPEGHGHPAAMRALSVVVRVGYARGRLTAARAAMLRVVREAEDDNVRLDVIDAAVVANDLEAAADALDGLDGLLPLFADEQRVAIVAARLRIALAFEERGNTRQVARQRAAIRAQEFVLSRPLLERAAQWASRPRFEQLDQLLAWTTNPLRCDGRGGVTGAAAQQLETRLSDVATVRRRIEWFGVATLSVRARLREAAIHEAAASELLAAPARCAAERNESAQREITSRASSLELEANRVEHRDPRRADAMRVEALLLRERGVSSAPPTTATAESELASLGESERRQSAAAIAAAAALIPAASDRERAYSLEPDRSDPEANAQMARFIARAIDRWRADL